MIIYVIYVGRAPSPAAVDLDLSPQQFWVEQVLAGAALGGAAL
jgi:hypothetical protein